MTGVNGRIAPITDGGRGIGRATAELFASRGAWSRAIEYTPSRHGFALPIQTLQIRHHVSINHKDDLRERLRTNDFKSDIPFRHR